MRQLTTRAPLPQGPGPEIPPPGHGAAAPEAEITVWEAAPLSAAVRRIGLCMGGLALCRELIAQTGIRWSAPAWKLILAKALERCDELAKAAGIMQTEVGKKAVA